MAPLESDREEQILREAAEIAEADLERETEAETVEEAS
jgi:hypothetical protein